VALLFDVYYHPPYYNLLRAFSISCTVLKVVEEASVLKIPSTKLDRKQEALVQADRVIQSSHQGKSPYIQ
jgi:hypothetical protein